MWPCLFRVERSIDQRERFEDQLHFRKGDDEAIVLLTQDFLRALESECLQTVGLGIVI